jgi:hypothetical protein
VVTGHDADRGVVGDTGHTRDNRARSDVQQGGGEAKDLVPRPDNRAADIAGGENDVLRGRGQTLDVMVTTSTTCGAGGAEEWRDV